ncbi:MAG TPA: sodium:proton antiporter [Gemmatimonadetes bacterium]|nr:sodium:proton antiporter [Gemmatimonadota bacterium]HBV05796.1 sodium:proton antiporter [Gemmatimonadota bacterium]
MATPPHCSDAFVFPSELSMQLSTIARPIAFGLLAFLLPLPLLAQNQGEAPAVILSDIPFDIKVLGEGSELSRFEVRNHAGKILSSGTVLPQESASAAGLIVGSTDELPLTVTVGNESFTVDAPVIPGWVSILPPLLAIALALIFREVITALLAGVWLGTFFVVGFNPLTATGRLVDLFLVPAVANADHAAIMVFTLFLGAMVGIVSRNGGTQGIVKAVEPLASNPKRGKLATWLAGMAIFFDDYANTLIVGNTMRPITDRLKISREKLAYLVDSTAAPVAALVPVSTWVGYEISLIGDGLSIAASQTPQAAGILLQASPFSIFLQTIPYLFYPLLALAFVFMTSISGRDFGPMAQAELRANAGKGLYATNAALPTDTALEEMQPKSGVPQHWWNAALPVLSVIFIVLATLYTTGRAGAGPGAELRDVFAQAQSYNALLWGSFGGAVVAIALSLSQKILNLRECISAAVGGFKSMMIAMIILVLAWSLGSVTETIGTSLFLQTILSDRIAVQLIPVIIFVTSGAMAFATGTSWGTMAIMLPVAIPLVVGLGGVDVLPGGALDAILLGSISSVLAGAIWGDHCSPISDTTVLSSTASACDHVDHVKTQLPYALAVGILSMLLGNIGTAYGLPPIAGLVIGVILLAILLRTTGVLVHDTQA